MNLQHLIESGKLQLYLLIVFIEGNKKFASFQQIKVTYSLFTSLYTDIVNE